LLVRSAKSAADLEKQNASPSKDIGISAVITLFLIGLHAPVYSQSSTASEVPDVFNAGISETAFYMIIGVVLIEMVVMIVLLLQLRGFLIQGNNEIIAPRKRKAYGFKWLLLWQKINAFRNSEKEQDLDLGHDYDGIRELDNRLPPWWLYGFYLTIVVGLVYLWQHHVSYNAPSSIEEYQIAMKAAEEQHVAYLKKAANLVDENTVHILTDQDAISKGKQVFEINCAACHGKAGEGGVGPNLTDDYWLHGGDVKSVFKTIKYGWPEKGMKAWKEDLSPTQIAELATFIRTLAHTNPANPKEKEGELYQETDAGKSDSLSSINKTLTTASVVH
ncbi:MAG: c-type cytochrome, partial [Chitinophagaceae bacterium]